MIAIRAATKNDALLIADLSRQTFYETFASDNKKEDMDKFLSEQFTRGKLMLEVGARDNYFFIASVDEQVAGYIKIRDGFPPVSLGTGNALEIARLYALSHMIGKGIGRELMNSGIKFAREMKKEMIWLGVWEKNSRAINFYSKLGFEKFGETNFLLGNDLQRDWLMCKKI